MLNNKKSKIGSQKKMEECVAFAKEFGIKKASEKYKISPRSVNRLKYNVRKNIPFGRKPYKKKISDGVVDALLNIVNNNPLVAPKDIPKMVPDDNNIKNLRPSTIYSILKKNGYTKKKVSLKKKKVENATKVSYLNYIIPILRKYLRRKAKGKAVMVYIDETGNYSSIKKTYGYSKAGRRIVDYELQKPIKINTFAGITDEGKIYTQDYTDNFKGDTFVSSVRTLCRKLPRNKKIYLFMDNAQFHKTKEFKKFIGGYGGRVIPIYNIPYSPEYNPIEYVFGEVKRFLRNANITNQNFNEILRQAFKNVKKANILKYINHSSNALMELARSLGIG